MLNLPTYPKHQQNNPADPDQIFDRSLIDVLKSDNLQFHNAVSNIRKSNKSYKSIYVKSQITSDEETLSGSNKRFS